ncbi:MAG: class Ib ribonucleoside-diphosphate reductase assembly flavoprotein NrdI [Mycoplasmatales bacterium]
MKLVYATQTGNVESFVERLNIDALKVEDGNETINEDFLLITYSMDYGDIPYELEDFLEENSGHLKAVVASGDKSYGDDYCKTAETIADQFSVPVLHTFENEGTEADEKIILDFLNS